MANLANEGQTSPSLLIRVRDPADGDAWRRFVEIYEPLVHRYALNRRLQHADAADLTQQVLWDVSQAIRRFDYDPRRGSFRGWLFSVVRSRLIKWRAKQQRGPQGSGDTATEGVLLGQPDRAAEEAAWDLEYERRLFLWAAGRVRGRFGEDRWQAFWRTAVEGQAAAEVAAALGMSLGAVYTAKSRVFDRIRKEIRGIQGEA